MNYDVKAVTDFDLTVRKNEQIYLIKKVNEDWCEAQNQLNQVGFVPLACIGLKNTQIDNHKVSDYNNLSTQKKVLLRSKTEADLNKQQTQTS